MALNYQIVKEQLTVFAQDASIATFDASLAYPIALAQSYTLDETGDTQEVQDLCSAQADWANPEVNKKNWTLTTDTLLLRPVATDTGTVDIGSKKDAYNLTLGQNLWCVVGDASMCTSPLVANLKYRYGLATVTSKSQSGNVGEFHTLSVTFTGKGELKYSE